MTHAPDKAMTVVCVASYFKGNDFLNECKRQGCRVILITREKLLSADWARESLDGVITVANNAPPDEYLRAISQAARYFKVDILVALEEFDVITTASAREHLCIDGLGSTQARLYRDKLAMRMRAREAGLIQPPFVSLFNYQEIGEFMERFAPPWVIKPRADASAMGIRKLYEVEDVWRTINMLDEREDTRERASYYLLEQFIEGDVFHVDSLVSEGRVAFAGVNRYAHPPLEIAQEGGVPISYTVKYSAPERKRLLTANRRLIKSMGLSHGVTHAEFIRGAVEGQFYFLEIAARVGGAHTSETLEAASGINLWREWARVEIAAHSNLAYEPPPMRRDYAGIALSLARQEHPDTCQFTDPEIVYRVRKPNHVGLIVRSPKQNRVLELLDDYARRFTEDFMMVLPPQEKPD
jgi:biotin carboxylase